MIVHLDGRVTRRVRRLLVRGEQLHPRGPRRAAPSSIPFSRSISRTASMISWLMTRSHPRSGWPARSRCTGCGILGAVCGGDGDAVRSGGDDLALELLAAHHPHLDAAADRVGEVLVRAQRALEPGRGDLDRVLAEVVRGRTLTGDALTELVVDPVRVVDEDAEARRRDELDGEDVRRRPARRARLAGRSRYSACAPSRMSSASAAPSLTALSQKMGPAGPFQ